MSGLRSFAFGDERNIVRALGSVLLAVSVLVILYRTSIFDPWGDLAVFLALAAPTLFLLGFGLLGGRERAGLPTGWQAAFTVVGLLLLPLALYAFLALVDGDADSNWNTIWIFGLVAIASLAVALVAGVRVGCLFAAVALLVVWLALWDELLTDGIGADAGTLRWLLLVAAGLLVLLALGLDLRGHPDGGASDVIAVAGITAVVAGALSVAGAGSVIISAALAEAEAPSEIGTSTFWEAELLVVSLALVLYGSHSATRGPTYFGGLGLIAFIFVVGADLDNPDRDGSLLGWPLLLLIATVLVFAWSAIPGRRRLDE